MVVKAAQPAGSSCVTRSVPLQLVCGTSKPSGGCVVLVGGLPVGGLEGPRREPAVNNPESNPEGFLAPLSSAEPGHPAQQRR